MDERDVESSISEPPPPYRRLEKAPALGPVQSVKAVLTQAFSFRGRARRSEYWWFSLLALGVYVVLLLTSGWNLLTVVVVGLLLVPSLSVSVRRLHDTDRSGWWLLLNVIPVASLLLIIWMSDDSGDDNKYGPYPKWAS